MSDFLHFQQVFSQAAPMPDRWVFFLHGIFGSGRNWNGIAKRVVERSPGVGAVLVDLRLHGQSTTDFSPPHTVEACGADVQKLAARFGDVEAIDEGAAARIEAASRQSDRVHLHRLAGHHWIHVDNQDGVVGLLASHLLGRAKIT